MSRRRASGNISPDEQIVANLIDDRDNELLVVQQLAEAST